MDVIDSFGEWARRRRTALGMTRAELAKCACCSVSALRKIEADERRPSRQLARLLAECLDIPSEEQSSFVDAARGIRPVAQLGQPAPGAAGPAVAQLPASLPTSPGKTQASPDWHLPAPATPLVGREAELAALTQLLSDPGCRLLTLLGPGGIGKTRLALEASCLVWDHFADGVFLVPLAATRSAEFMESSIARAAGLNFAGPAEPRQQLVNFLSSKRALLLLDNLEHLLDRVEVLAEILEKAPDVKLLATSRERLQLQGEWAFEVQGLPVPAEGQVEGVENYSAVQLFLQRARQARANFEFVEEDRPHVVRICRLVEGMPLAIELAAAWVSVLSCREIVNEIERGLDILTTRLRDVPERQRSLRVVFDHSWELLAEEEQRVLRQMAVFRGGFRREAALVVAGADLAVLSSLLAQSFLRCTSGGRFTIHALIRYYVAGHLSKDAEEMKAARDRHSAYYTDFVARREGELKGARQQEALAEIDDEIDNIRSAWRRAVRREELANVRRTLRALWYFYDIRGWFQEALTGLRWAADQLEQRALPGRAEPDIAILHAYLRAQQGWFCLRVGRFEEARQLLQASLDVLREAEAYVELVDALQHAGALDRLMGNYSRSRAHYEEMWRYALQTDDPWNATIAEGDVGLAAQALGDYEEAQERMAATVTSFRTLGDRRMLAVALHFLGGISCMLGEYERAESYLRESLALSRAIGDRWIESMTLRELGNVARATGAHAEAASLFGDSLALAREIGEHWSILQGLNSFGTTMLALGDFAAARAALTEGLAVAWEMQALPDVLAALGGLAQWAVRQEPQEAELERALTVTSFILNHPAASQKTKDEACRLRSELEARLGPAVAGAAQATEKELSLANLVASILAPAPAQ